ncbi:ABC transporter substrate-binding protein [Aquincola sp. S2]|uniref:ABC transporter substrate-binding protein n=1 Tax=Pseudaquabacterium terrae TaxID=2732868 RepID=A0ABX2EF87_9BURK|nr:ABC transporter substrate-binding protein [Aquabacterium terrae]NRF67271.1 ABC transporter substrate-binding protein [Aquabacterium terrae]
MSVVGRRRFLIAASALLAVPGIATTQAQRRLPVLGILNDLPAPTLEQIASSAPTKRLQELGWIEGKTLIVERANSAGSTERLPKLAAELVRKKVDVIWAISPPAAVAAARATRPIPIVFVRVAAPLELGLGASFARPGGNVTGVASTAGFGVYLKRLELLREILPGAKRLAAIDPGTVIYATVDGGVWKPDRDRAVSEARKVGFDLSSHFVDEAKDLDAAFTAITASGAQALLVSASPLIVRERRRIIDFANRSRLPSAFIESFFVDEGGLLSYGSDVSATVLQSLAQVDKILRGAKPAEMPIELPLRFDLVVNQKTARMLGLTIPPTMLMRADRVVE